MLCFEGIALNLNVFLERREMPQFSLKAPASGKLESVIVKEEVIAAHSALRSMLLTHFRHHK